MDKGKVRICEKNKYVCLTCGAVFYRPPSKPRRTCSMECSRNDVGLRLWRSKNAPNRKDGRIKTSHGYIRVYCLNHPHADKNNRVYEHRLVAEKKLGRPLRNNEEIHHVNNKKDDNNPDNIMILTKKEHRRLHWMGKLNPRSKNYERVTCT